MNKVDLHELLCSQYQLNAHDVQAWIECVQRIYDEHRCQRYMTGQFLRELKESWEFSCDVGIADALDREGGFIEERREHGEASISPLPDFDDIFLRQGVP